MKRWVIATGLCGVVCAAVGCSDGGGGSGDAETAYDSENIGMATFELALVPNAVGCVRITVSGSSTVTKDFTLAANTSTAALNMDRLPLGAVSISGAAYATTCGTGATLYVADPAAAVIETGVLTTLPITFRKNNAVAANVNFVGNISKLSTGYYDTALVVDGFVYTWGYNTGTNVPTLLSGLSNVVDVAVSLNTYSLCALKSDGTIWCWGDNSYGQLGQAPIGGYFSTPVQVGTETGYTALHRGGYAFCGTKGLAKTTKCWGRNSAGQLGVGNTTNTATPVAPILTSFASVAGGASTTTCFANSVDLKVSCTGNNAYGQLGDGTLVSSTSPVAVPNLTALGFAVGTYHSCALSPTGGVKCWGLGTNGELGNGGTANSSAPVDVTGLTSGVSSIHAGYSHTCARLDSGSVKCWGAGSNGQLGDGFLLNRSAPVQVPLPGNVELLATGWAHSCAVTEAHDLYCWGNNQVGQLGDGGYVTAAKPVRVRLP